MKVCLDTNVLVAAFATRGLCADLLRTVVTKHELVIGEVILTELRRVLRTRIRLPDAQLRSVEAALAQYPVVPKPTAPTMIELRDHSDRWIIATAVDGGADALVTGDQDLLIARASAPLPIVDPREFWELLRRGSRG
ncbi:MAG: putative toxin-antitoxin system toxin component, PIN family [Gemmatimonadetes bacterium]|nr:putative toxin-antitoxin system toxin component, PIN family [Gemmatimonadota bacterium]